MTLLQELPPPPPPASPREPLSAPLRQPLELVIAHIRLLRWTAAVLAITLAVSSSALLLAWLLGNAAMAPPARIAIVLSVLGVILLGAALLIRRACAATTLPMAARAMEHAAPELEERLTSAYELSAEPHPDFRGSPDLLARLNDEAATQAHAIDPGAVVSGRTVLTLLALLTPVLLAWIAALIIAPHALGRGLRQTLFPWQHIVTPLPTITVTPGDTAIPAGDPLDIRALFLDPHGAPRATVHAATLTLSPATGAPTLLDMVPDPINPATFSARIDQLNQPMQYQIAGGGTTSATYRATILVRPIIRRVTLTYRYPAYTRLASKTVESNDGAISAVVGSTVTVTVHTDSTLAPESALITAPGAAQERVFRLSAGAEQTYSVDVPITRTEPYIIRLQNPPSPSGAPGLTNAHEPARTITALPDEPPAIAITDPHEPLRIRPSDSIDLTYHASDDFGLSAIDALIQFDDGPVQTTPLPLEPNRRAIAGRLHLNLPDLLAGHTDPLPAQVRIRLRATDNMTPVPQTTLSAPAVLLLDPAAATMAAHAEIADAERLHSAAAAAQQVADTARQQVAALRAAAPRGLNEDQQQQAAGIAAQVRSAGAALRSAASAPTSPAFQGLADQLKQTADQPLASGAAQSDRAANTTGAAQAAALRQSQGNLRQASEQLAALQGQIDQAATGRDIARQLTDAAREQQHIADHLATSTGAARDKLLDQQKALNAKVAALLAGHPALQQPLREATARQAAHAAQQVDTAAQRQAAVARTIEQRAADQAALQRVNDLAQQQKALDDRMAALARDHAGELQQNGAALPKPAEGAVAAQNLQRGALDTAADQQRAMAESMAQAAQRLSAGADPAAAARAKYLDDKARALGQEIQSAKAANNPPTLPSDPANRQAKSLADAVRQEARDLAQRNPGAKPAADRIAAASAKAKAAASAGQASAAQQALQQATGELRQATPEPTAAARDASGKTAAQEAADMAQREKQLADQAAAAAAAQQRQQSNAGPSPAQTKRQSDGVAQRIAQAAQAAGAMRQQTQSAAPQLSQQAAQAQQDLHDAAQEQQAAGESSDPQEAATHQAAAQEKVTAAQKLLSKLSSAGQGSGNSGDSKSSSNSAGGASGRAEQSGLAGASAAKSPQSGGPGEASAGQRAQGGQAEQAAQSAQLGRGLMQTMSAQRRAADGNIAAARQAADLLNQQAGAMERQTTARSAASSAASSGSAGMPSGAASNASSGASGGAASGISASGATAGQPSLTPSPGGIGGMVPHPSGGPTPSSAAAAAQVGIPPSEWAKLSPDMQRQWLNAAQQNAPPQYQQAVRDYFRRIAELSNAPAPTGASR